MKKVAHEMSTEGNTEIAMHLSLLITLSVSVTLHLHMERHCVELQRKNTMKVVR